MPQIHPDIEEGKLAVNYADYTQRIMNALPEFHIGRRYKESTVAKIANAVAGKSLESFYEYEVPNIASQTNLPIASTLPNDKAFIIDTSGQNSVKRQVVPNRVRNSTFKQWTNPVLPPDFWTASAEDPDLNHFIDCIQAYPVENFTDGIALRMGVLTNTNLPLGTVSFLQEVEIPSTNEELQWELSCWTKRAGLDNIVPGDFVMVIKVENGLGVSDLASLNITDSTYWKRNRLRVDLRNVPGGKITKLIIGIEIATQSSINPRTIEVTSFFLAPSHTTNAWAKHPEDKPRFINTLQSGKTVIDTYRESVRRNQYYEIQSDEITRSLLPSSADIEFFPLAEDAQVEVPPVQFINVPNGYYSTGRQIPQGVAIASLAAINKYGWPLSIQGTLVKVDLRDPSEILGVYKPSFPVDAFTAYAVSSIQLQCMTRQGNTLWILARLLPGSSMKYMSTIDLFLYALDMNFPKVSNDQDDVDPTVPIFLPIRAAYFFTGASVGGSYGSLPYGNSPWGGATPVTQINHLSMEFISNRQIKTVMQHYFESTITLRYRYFIDQGSSIILLEDPREVNSSSEVVVW